MNTQTYFTQIQIARPNVSIKTIYAHLNSIHKIETNMDKLIVDSNLEDVLEWILKSIDNHNTRANYLCALSVLVDAFKQHGTWDPWQPTTEAFLKKIRENISDVKNTIQLNLNDHKKSNIQIDNWISHKQILSAIKKQGEVSKELMSHGFTGSKSTINTIQNWVIQSLYMLDPENPPIRCNYCMKVLYGNNQAFSAFLKSNNNQNYLIVMDDTMTFVFNKYKTKKHYGQKIHKVGNQLYEVLKLYLNYRSNPVDLLINTRNKALSENNLSVYIKNAFSIYNKKLTIDTLRHIYISEKVTLENSKKVATLMHHSLGEQEQYWKKN